MITHEPMLMQNWCNVCSALTNASRCGSYLPPIP